MKTTANTRQTELYSDFRTDFSPHPIKGDLVRITNTEAVKRSVRNIVLTAQYERFGNPNFGAGVRALLFENPSVIVADMLRDELRVAINNHEKRAKIIEIYVGITPDANGYSATIVFSTINNIEPVRITQLLTRIR